MKTMRREQTLQLGGVDRLGGAALELELDDGVFGNFPPGFFIDPGGRGVGQRGDVGGEGQDGPRGEGMLFDADLAGGQLDDDERP